MRPRLLPLVLWLGLAFACGGARGAQQGDTPPPPDTTVEVRSFKKVDVNLFVLSPTRRIRLGTVPGMTTRAFVVPPAALSDSGRVRFGIEVIGTYGANDIGSERRFESEQELNVRPGDTLSLTVR
ncbi:hypothetical protein LZ198_28635 [Myxococcus sp. K15C18031901]|uniref:hypothetical protein n=1 Tax=Myxococcus dinghuensis TaxID=2906761 RepID=UPI0020A7AD7C|nr:hypothetical protein [Myxococcus dinghuensis]MCP3102851.1 hypothetical protein [Myxococcus dinghuensis]